jgi:hypothetical protein
MPTSWIRSSTRAGPSLANSWRANARTFSRASSRFP